MSDEAYEGYVGTPALEFRGIGEIVEEKNEKADEVTQAELAQQQRFQSTLEGHIVRVYEENKRAREESGVEEEMIRSLYQVNGEYTDEEKSRMLTGSQIWMNITATKSRQGRSWIKELLQPANAWPLEFRPSEVEDIPPEMEDKLREAFNKDSKRLLERLEREFDEEQGGGQQPQLPAGEQPGGQPDQGQSGGQQPPPDKEPSALLASRKLKATAELKRDIHESVITEINKVAKQQAKAIERYVLDDLQKGGWNQAFSEFINDFTIYPTAFIKGPVVTTKKRLTYINGVPSEVREVVYLNKRVCPLDVYPSPSASHIDEGNFIEHIRLSRKDLSDLAHLCDTHPEYKKENILEVLESNPDSLMGSYDQKIEQAKAKLEKRGNQTSANVGIYHGYHFWGTAKVEMLLDWGLDRELVRDKQMWEEVEIEAILVNHRVIKCAINSDPLGRRPYYAASYQTRSGSVWGRSMPYLMRDCQRMCNATARSLSDNMGLSSGPQCAILVDRLADDGDITEQEPRRIWQFTSDPQGNGGRPIEFFDVPSKANELMAVYDKFEIKADDATGIPRYTYGNENVGGAAATMGGLAILMESASKGIKDAIKNISEGVLVPRALYQFYLHMLNAYNEGKPLKYHGDIDVVVFAAEAISMKAAEQEQQRELLKATANEFDMSVIGSVGRADMLREVFKTANFPESIIPSRLEVKNKDAENKREAEKQQQQQAQAQQQGNQTGIEATKLQVEGQMAMHEKTQAVKQMDIETRAEAKKVDQKLKAVELDQKAQATAAKNLQDSENLVKKLAAEEAKQNKQLAVNISQRQTAMDQPQTTPFG